MFLTFQEKIEANKGNIAYICYLFLGFSLLFHLRVFNMVSPDSSFVFGLKIRDFGSFFVLFLFLISLFVHFFNYHRKQVCIPLLPFFVCISFSALLSSYQAWALYQQSFLLGLRAQRDLFLLPLLYYSLVLLRNDGVLTRQGIEKVLFVVSLGEMIVGFLQKAVGPNHLFTYENYGTRDGMTRFVFDTNLCIVCLAISLNNIVLFLKKGRGIKRLFSNRQNLFYVCYSVISPLFIIFVPMYRGIIISMFLALIFTFVAIFFFSNPSKKKKLIFLFTVCYVVLCLSIFLFGTEKGKYLFYSKLLETSTYRFFDLYYFFSFLQQHPLLGSGLPNETYDWAMQATRLANELFPVDVGIIGIAFNYGLLGFFFSVFFLLYLVVFASRVYKSSYDISFLILSFFLLSSCITVQPPFMTSYMIFLLPFLSFFDESEGFGASVEQKKDSFFANKKISSRVLF